MFESDQHKYVPRERAVKIRDFLLKLLVEERDYSALFLDDALKIIRVECPDPDLRAPLGHFLDRPIFDLLPEMSTQKEHILSLSSPFEHFTQKEQRLSHLNPHGLYDLFVLGPDPDRVPPLSLVLLCPSQSDRQHLLDKLREERKAKQRARRATTQTRRASTKFLANISHEIRTPMNGVIGMTELLLNTDQTDEQREYTEIIRTSGEALLSVINDILDYSKIESNHVAVEKEAFNIRTCIEECLDMHAAEAAQKNIELLYSLVHPCPDIIISDRAKFIQILNNLISNAVKFTNQGEVVIGVKCENGVKGSRLFVQVRDTGIGIPKYAQKQIFAAFEQMQSAQIGRQGGTGLGLAIAQKLVHLLGGALYVKSQLGTGSTFSFDIAIDYPVDAAPRSKTQPTTLLENKHALIVDDNSTNRKILAEQLAQWGMITDQAENGDAALSILKKNPHFDLAILDMHMPTLSGLHVAKSIGKNQALEHLSLLLQTSVDGPKDKNLLKQYNIDRYVTKPIKQSQLFDILVGLFSENTAHTPSNGAPLDSSLAEKYPRDILVAEDNRANQQVILNLLQNLGYKPELVENGQDVLHALEHKRFDLILMDIQMPKLDGIETARQICERTRPEQRPNIIALTAHAMPGDREKFLNAGMTGYLSKPLKIKSLVEAIQNSVSPMPKPIEPQTRSPHTENSINAEYIRTIMGLHESDDNDVILDLVDTFLTETTELWHELKDGLAGKNFDQIYRAAHTLKSSCTIIGAHRFSELADALIEPAQAQNPMKIETILKTMKAEKKAVFAAAQKLSADLGHTAEY